MYLSLFEDVNFIEKNLKVNKEINLHKCVVFKQNFCVIAQSAADGVKRGF